MPDQVRRQIGRWPPPHSRNGYRLRTRVRPTAPPMLGFSIARCPSSNPLAGDLGPSSVSLVSIALEAVL